MKPPEIRCRQLAAFDRTDLAAVQRAFSAAQACALGQSWLPGLQAEFRPAAARTGYDKTALLVFAEMADDDIFSKARRLNERTWELGDSFEMFLQVEGACSYAEFHVTPDNQKLQMRIPLPRPAGRPAEEMMLAGNLFESRAWVADKSWHVLASIPFESTGGRPRWFSFSRYDFTRGRPEPVLSSSSPHERCDFHRRADWGALKYE